MGAKKEEETDWVFRSGMRCFKGRGCEGEVGAGGGVKGGVEDVEGAGVRGGGVDGVNDVESRGGGGEGLESGVESWEECAEGGESGRHFGHGGGDVVVVVGVTLERCLGKKAKSGGEGWGYEHESCKILMG